MPEMLANGQVWSNGKTRRTIQQAPELRNGVVFFYTASSETCVAESTFQRWIKRTRAKCEVRVG
jgi:hypothetical protein